MGRMNEEPEWKRGADLEVHVAGDGHVAHAVAVALHALRKGKNDANNR